MCVLEFLGIIALSACLYSHYSVSLTPTRSGKAAARDFCEYIAWSAAIIKYSRTISRSTDFKLFYIGKTRNSFIYLPGRPVSLFYGRKRVAVCSLQSFDQIGQSNFISVSVA